MVHKFGNWRKQIGKKSTMVYADEGLTKIRYHDTDVVSFNDKKVVLNSGYWYTSTTKRRMNQASNYFDLGFNVHQKDSYWFVDYKGKTIPFEEGMTLRR